MQFKFIGDALRMAKPFADDALKLGKGLWTKAGPGARKVIQTVGPSAAMGGVVGGVQGARQGGVGDVVAGTLGGAVGGTLTGSIPGVAGLNPYAQAAIGGAGGLYGPGLMGATGNVVQQGANTVGGAAALNMQNQPNVTGGYIGGDGGPVPTLGGEHGRMIVGPDGNIYEQVRLDGYRQGARMGSGLDTMQNISNDNRWFNSRFPQREMVRKADMQREIAAQQLKRNMDLAKDIVGGTHKSTLNIAEQAGRDQGSLLNSHVTYF